MRRVAFATQAVWTMNADVCFRPKADVRRGARSATCWVRLYIGLLAEPCRHNIEPYRGDGPPYGGLWVSRVTGPRDPAIRWLAVCPSVAARQLAKV